MRISSCILLCLFSATLVSSVSIVNVPKRFMEESPSISDIEETAIDNDSLDEYTNNLFTDNNLANRKLLVKLGSSKSKKKTNSGSTKNVNANAPSPVSKSVEMPIYMTCDNEFNLYVNGNKVGSGNTWTTTYYFSSIVNNGDVIAIDGIDHGGPAAFIGVFGGKVTKPSEWKCSTNGGPGWANNNFDDSSWSNAVSYGKNQEKNIWNSVGSGSRPNIPGDAEWLWTSNNNDHNRVYCRYFPVKPAPAPAPETDSEPELDVEPSPKSVILPSSKQTAMNEINADNKKTNVNIFKFQEKIKTLIDETTQEQIKVENENKNNYNGVNNTLKNEQLHLEASLKIMNNLHLEIISLNQTIQTHYKKLLSDTNYLQTLEEMRPEFLKSLDELASHIQNVKNIVDSKIVKDQYKDEMINLLTGIHFNTHNISGYIATAFINHYNKYKNLIKNENEDYSNELKRLTQLSTEYNVQVQKTADIEKERTRLQEILARLNETISLSVTQREEFNLLVNEIMLIFDNKPC